MTCLHLHDKVGQKPHLQHWDHRYPGLTGRVSPSRAGAKRMGHPGASDAPGIPSRICGWPSKGSAGAAHAI